MAFGAAASKAGDLFGQSNDGGSGSDIQASGQQAYDRSKQTPDEASQYSNSFDIGKFLEQYLGAQAGKNAMPEGAQTGEQQYQNQGALNKSIYDQTLSQAQNPDAYYQSTLQPDLTQAQDTINTYYQKRGLLNSGLAIESMGRAGVDLAIKDAQARMASRQQSLQNAQGLSQNIYANNQNSIGNLASLYTNQQQFGQNSLSRQAGAAQNAAGYQAYPAQAALGSYYGGVAAQQALPGQLLGAGAKVAAAGMGGV